ncbi:MAG TPA: carbon starvation CstA family protein, partial [Nitrospirales bacterium]|nr:carbon starvation CstA family protein [Nitrospirales bacterium]
MRPVVMFGWGLLAILAAVAFAIVTGVLHPGERVNGLWLVIAAACCYALGLRFYGRFLARQVFELDDARTTPAHRLNDGTNFHPTNKYVLFGHHFAAIA